MDATSPRAVPGFVALWLGTGVSALGTFVGSLALSFALVQTLDASPAWVAAIGVVQLLAGIVASPFAGVLADRHRRRTLMVGADVVRAVAVASLPIAHAAGVLQLWMAAVVAAITGMANHVFNAAYASHLPRLVGRERIVRANATIAATVSVAEVAGFAAAGWLVDLLDAPNALVVDAASFVVSAVCILAIRAPEPVRAARRRRQGGGVREALAGAAHVRRDPVLRSLVGTAAIYDASSAAIGASYLLYLSREVGFADGVLGSVFAIGGLTSLVGARLAARAEQAGRIGRTMALGGLVRTIGTAAMPAAWSPGAAGTALIVTNQVVTDPAWMVQEVAEASIRQSRAPDEIAGRINATHQLAGSVGRLTGTAAAGAIGELAGPRTALWTGTGLALAATVVLALSPTARVSRAGSTAEVPLSAQM